MKFSKDETIFYTLFALSGVMLIVAIAIQPFTKMNKLRLDLVEVVVTMLSIQNETPKAGEDLPMKKYVDKYNERKETMIEKMKQEDMPDVLCTMLENSDPYELNNDILLHKPLLENFLLHGLLQYIVINMFMDREVDLEKVKAYLFATPEFSKYSKTYKDKPQDYTEALEKQRETENKLIFRLDIHNSTLSRKEHDEMLEKDMKERYGDRKYVKNLKINDKEE